MEEKELTGYPSIDKPWLKFYKNYLPYEKPEDMSVYDYLKHENLDRMDRVAIRCMGNTVTYRELFERIDAVAYSLRAIGIGNGDVVVISLPAIPEEVYLFYALAKIGACANYLFPNTPADKICEIIRTFNSKCFISLDLVDDEYLYKKTSLENVVVLPTSGRMIQNSKTLSWSSFLERQRTDVPRREPSQMVFVAKTGGSTGVPKNVALSDKSFNHMVHQYLSSELDYQVGDRWLRLWPIFSATAAVSSNHLPLCAGMELILDPTGNMMALGETLLREHPNHIPMAPAILDILLNSSVLEGQDLSFLKSVGCGGSGMTEEFEKKVYEFFDKHNIKTYLGCGYGMTENGSVATIRMSRETANICCGGVPMIDMDVAIFRPDTYIEEPYNTMGEICIRSDTFMLGYLGNEMLTHQVLRDHGNGDVWLHSGDLGYMDEDGRVYIKDRLTRIFAAYPCEKIYPSEIEQQIETVEGVDRAAVFAVEDSEHDGFSLAACALIIRPDFEGSEVMSDVQQYCESHFPTYSKPRIYTIRESFPLTPIGKVDYRALERETENVC